MKDNIAEALQETLEEVGFEAYTIKKVLKTIGKFKSKYKFVTNEDIEAYAILGIYEAVESNTLEDMALSYLETHIKKYIFEGRKKEMFAIQFDSKYFKIWRMYENGESIEKIAEKTGYSKECIKNIIMAKGIKEMASINLEFPIEEMENIKFNFVDGISHLNSTMFADRSCKSNLGGSNWNSGLSDLYYGYLSPEEAVIYNDFKNKLPSDLLEILELLEEGFKKIEIAEMLNISNAKLTRKISKIVEFAKEQGFLL